MKHEIKLGDVFGRWTVISEPYYNLSPGGYKRQYVDCRCVCGKEAPIEPRSLRIGRSTGCRGCIEASKTTVDSVTNEIWLQYQRGASTRGWEWTISREDFTVLIHSDCFYCGGPPSNRAKRKVDFFTNGIDRKDNKLGYTKENCVACCSKCNRGKHTIDYDTWIEYLDNLVAYRQSLKSTK